ncbi:MAG TPA: tRNA pseudouridine(38-40) synthase TruA [Ignavibacteria bacterium]|jgi:tRNA pseudouridine38-40 synthase
MRPFASLRAGEIIINIKLTIEYDGKNYFGWQRQSGKQTIQQVIEESLQLLFPGENIKLAGAGRTDTGVHARGHAANFKVTKHSFEKLGKETFLKSLNGILPSDIAVKKAERVKNDFHARYSAVGRTYRYYLCFRKHALNGEKLHFVKTKFDIDLAKEFCKLLPGAQSFKSLCKNKEDKHNFFCSVTKAGIKKLKDDIIEFEITANRFLHSMVRAIVGAMIKIASGKLTISEFKQKFKKGEILTIQYAPSNALFLHKINY